MGDYMHVSLLEIAQLVDGVLVGDANIMISSLSPIDDIAEGSLIFAEGAENLTRAENSSAAAILVSSEVNSLKKPIIRVAAPFKTFMSLVTRFYPPKSVKPGIHATAVIAPDVKMGQGVYIGPFVNIESGCVIGDNVILKSHIHIGHDVIIGRDTVIHPQVTIYDNCQLGEKVIIHASSVIGSDGFGYAFLDGKHQKVPHAGIVRIENEVEIGASTTVDRATLGATVIGEGTKIDNLVQVAHSVKLGKHNILCAFTGIAGSSTSGNGVIFAANVGVSDHVRIDDGVILGARAGVPPKKHLLGGNVYIGNPARPKAKAIEQELAVTRIPFIRKNVKALSEKVEQLSQKISKIEDN
jgi:UDP-3-O-[3-hydroxymyristoyl] glucosamine N-acyltransferase